MTRLRYQVFGGAKMMYLNVRSSKAVSLTRSIAEGLNCAVLALKSCKAKGV